MTRRALVTGVSRGIGRAVAEMLLADGWEVLGVSRTPPPDAVYPTSAHYHWMSADVSQEEDSTRLAWWVRSGLDVVVHCAAIRGPHGPLIENDPAAWIEAVNTNLLGTYRVVRLALPALQQSWDARILLFSGGGAFGPSEDYSAYATAKSGVVGLMETLSAELQGTRVTCNAVAPGPIPTTIHGDNPLPDDGGAAMQTAVDCVRHLLSVNAHGLTGKTISAVWDDWDNILPVTVPHLNQSTMGTRMRRQVAMLKQKREVA